MCHRFAILQVALFMASQAAFAEPRARVDLHAAAQDEKDNAVWATVDLRQCRRAPAGDVAIPENEADFGSVIIFNVLAPAEHAGKVIVAHHDGLLASGELSSIVKSGRQYRMRVPVGMIREEPAGTGICSVNLVWQYKLEEIASPSTQPTTQPGKSPASSLFPAKARKPGRIVRVGPQSQIYSVSLCPDGRSAYAHIALREDRDMGRSRIVKLDLANGRLTHTVANPSPFDPDRFAETMRVTSDGRNLLVFGACLHTVKQVDVESGKLLRTYSTGREAFGRHSGSAPAVSVDGKLLYMPLREGRQDTDRVAAYDLAAGREVARLALHALNKDKDRLSIRLFPGETSVLIMELLEDSVRLTDWDTKTNKATESFQVPGPFKWVFCYIDPLPLSINSARLYVTAEADLQVWNLKSKKCEGTITPPAGRFVFQVQATPDDHILLANLYNEKTSDLFGVGIYDLKARQWVDVLDTTAFGSGYRKPVTSLNLSADGRTLVAIHEDDEEASDPTHHLAIFDLSRYSRAPASRPVP